LSPAGPSPAGFFVLQRGALLQVFLNSVSYTTDQLMCLTIIHLAFVASAFMLAYIDRLMGSGQSQEGRGVSYRLLDVESFRQDRHPIALYEQGFRTAQRLAVASRLASNRCS
jgi:hypothetical protein